MTHPAPLRPIVAVIGTTGVGKSQLAVSLARSLAQTSAVVLSADSMQLYKGLNVITNKVTEEEKQGVEHWGLDIVQPGEGGSWDVGRWCSEAAKKVASLSSETLPILCGGTHYFIQHFLFPPAELSTCRTSDAQETTRGSFNPLDVRWKPPCPRPSIPCDLDPELEKLLDSFWTARPVWPGDDASPSNRVTRPVPTESSHLLILHKLLEAVDPKEAGRWHWRDGRKVRRGLERWWERGGVDVQAKGDTPEGSGRRAKFRFLIFWVYEPLEALQPRLDRRVDRMVENGLLREITELREIAERIYGDVKTIDHTEGVFQAIGYKEFASLSLAQSNLSSDPHFAQMLGQTKHRTRQYAKSQLQWIRKQFLPAVAEAKALGGDVQVYAVRGGTDDEVATRNILHLFLSGAGLPKPELIGHPETAELLATLRKSATDLRIPDIAERQIIHSRTQCDVCSNPGKPHSVAVQDWDSHLSSKTHKRQVPNYRQNSFACLPDNGDSRIKQIEGHREKVREYQLAQQATKRAERELMRAARATAATQDAPD